MKPLSSICSAVILLSLVGGANADDLETSEAAVVQGEAWLNDMQEAYQAVPAIEEEITVSTEYYKKNRRTGGTVTSNTYRFAFSGQEQMLYEFDGGSVKINDGKIHAVSGSRPGRVLVAQQNQKSLVEAIRTEFAGLPIAFQLLMHDGAPMNQSLEAIAQGQLKGVKVVASGETTSHTQEMAYQVRLEGEAVNGKTGSAIVTISPITNLATEIKVNTEDEDTNYVNRLIIKSRIVDKLSTDLIETATSERRIVGSLAELLAPPAIGEKAPDFTLQDMEGNSVTLSLMEGKVVLLDFWATWCGPCKRGLPMVEELSKWAQDQNEEVLVYAVDIMERTSPPVTAKAVGDYWKQKGFTMPVLFASQSNLAMQWGIRSIPDTVIIGKDGKIAWRHKGYSPENLERWKKAIGQALSPTK